MSDHLISEANRHAKALTDERNNLVVELHLLREWQRETIQNERAHHAERKDAIARADRAEAELAAEKARLDWLMAGGVVLIPNGSGFYSSSLYYPVSRDGIDSAMKEGAK